jgi:hypothetical protein
MSAIQTTSKYHKHRKKVSVSKRYLIEDEIGANRFFFLNKQQLLELAKVWVNYLPLLRIWLSDGLLYSFAWKNRAKR